jgi:hypothetical protein
MMSYENEDKVLTSANEVPTISDLGLVDMNIVQVTCQRDISSTTFNQGVQDFLFNIHGSQRWSPSRSYFRMRCSLQVTDDAGVTYRQATADDDVALAEDFCNQLYSNVYVFLGNVSISSITQYVGEASMVRYRLHKTYSWLKSVGSDGYYLKPQFCDRQQTSTISAAGLQCGDVVDTIYAPFVGAATVTLTAANVLTLAGGNGQFKVGDVITVPPMDLSNATEYKIATLSTAEPAIGTVVVPPAVNIAAGTPISSRKRVSSLYSPMVTSVAGTKGNSLEVLFQPPVGIWNTDLALPSGAYRISLFPKQETTAGIQSLLTDKATTSKIVVENVQLFLSVFKDTKPFNDGSYYIPLIEQNIQNKTMATGASLNTFNYTIPASTIGLTSFVQAVQSGTTTLVPSSRFTAVTPAESLDMRFIQMTYGNVTKPTNNFSSSFSGAQGKYITQRWVETNINSGQYELSSETLDDYLARGPMFHFSFIRDAENRSTECQLQIQYGALTGNNNNFLVSHYRTLSKITVNSGYVTSVETLQI